MVGSFLVGWSELLDTDEAVASDASAPNLSHWRVALQSVQGLLRDFAALPALGGELGARFLRELTACHAQMRDRNVAMLNKDIESAGKDLDVAVQELEAVAYGGTEKGQIWWRGLPTEGTLDDLQKRAESRGFLGVDCADVEAKRLACKESHDALQKCHRMAGSAMDEKLDEHVSALLIRATTSQVERQLLDLARDPLADSETTRAQVQAEIRKVRAANGKEKDLFAAPLFKWALATLTARR